MLARVTKKQVENDFDKLKKYAKEQLVEGQFFQALSSIQTAAKLMYLFNVFYTDDDMENMLSDIAAKVLQNVTKDHQKKNDKRIIFYDFFARDYTVLTQQYINALIELDYEILFITYCDGNMKKSERTFNVLNQYEKAEIYVVKNKDYVEAANELASVINEFGAAKVLLHTVPWDVVGVLTWSYFNNIERYLINLTDHAFWLGKCCSDYILEYRSYGYNISRDHRNISEKKLIPLPYYPIEDPEVVFEGLPFDIKGKKLVFSGGTLYKIDGSDIFLNTIKYIVENHKDAIVLYVGSGNAKPFNEFVTKNNLSGKVYLLSDRKDFYHIFKHCYFYLGTYPISGGLMTQHAVSNKIIPVAYTDAEIKCNYIESLLINTEDISFTHTDLKEYYDKIDRLLTDEVYKHNLEEKLTNLIISPKEFRLNLSTALNEQSTRFVFEKDEIDIERFSKLYFDMEYAKLSNYAISFCRTKNFKLLLHFKKYLLIGSLCAAIHMRRTVKYFARLRSKIKSV